MNDLLQDQFKTFVYARRRRCSPELIRSEETSTPAMGERRGIVLVYRKGWGETPLASMRNAIRNGMRASKDSVGTLFVPSEKPPSVPTWLPEARLWLDWSARLKGLATVVENHIQCLAATAHVESMVGRAARLRRKWTSRGEAPVPGSAGSALPPARAAFERLTASLKSGVGRDRLGAPRWTEAQGNWGILERHGLGRGLRFAGGAAAPTRSTASLLEATLYNG